MPETSPPTFFDSDYACTEPAERAGWYEVRVYDPFTQDGLLVHETRNRIEANVFAGRLATIMRKWHNEPPPPAPATDGTDWVEWWAQHEIADGTT